MNETLIVRGCNNNRKWIINLGYNYTNKRQAFRQVIIQSVSRIQDFQLYQQVAQLLEA